MNGRKAGGLIYIALSVVLLWNALSDGEFTFTDSDDTGSTETITIEQNPIMFSTLIGIFAIIGGSGIRLLITEKKKEETQFEDEKGRFQWRSAPFYKVALWLFVLSYFGMSYLIALVICIYFSDFSTNQTRAIMASILGSLLLGRLISIALNTPKQIKEESDGLLVERWLFKPRFIPFSEIDKHTIDESRISIWFSNHKQVAFPRDALEEGAALTLARRLKMQMKHQGDLTPETTSPAS
ncbi:hypothetical protein [Pelagicoccus mobilis]|uniref:Uncharacterized protein n=1 Tax=Pelagicoccus mobilis TaxID=415221 RepID=A0A934RST4_9BACT|nr:hypothetical protein [Pelagicoccus mobilis]MBK1876212.1 hypothetical protein [Pelagicoccus mobilis]